MLVVYRSSRPICSRHKLSTQNEAHSLLSVKGRLTFHPKRVSLHLFSYQAASDFLCEARSTSSTPLLRTRFAWKLDRPLTEGEVRWNSLASCALWQREVELNSFLMASRVLSQDYFKTKFLFYVLCSRISRKKILLFKLILFITSE